MSEENLINDNDCAIYTSTQPVHTNTSTTVNDDERRIRINSSQQQRQTEQDKNNMTVCFHTLMTDFLTTDKTSVISFIPKSCREQAARLYCSILSAITSEPTAERNWIRLFLFARSCLAVPNRGGKKNKQSNICNLNEKMHLFEISDNHTLLHRLSNTYTKVKQKKNISEEKIIKNVTYKIEEGNIQNATRLLTSNDTFAPDTEETRQLLQEKHPNAPPDRRIYPPTNNIAFETDSDTVRLVLQSFPKGSSGGLDLVSPQILKDMFLNVTENTTKSANLDTLADFINCVLAGKTPQFAAPFFFGARLIALSKHDGGVRPIAIGNTLRRLSAKVLNKWAMLKSAPLFQSVQYGAGARNGAETVIHRVRSFLSSSDDTCLVKIDFKNAFNTIRRDCFLEHVAVSLPRAYNFVHSAYGLPSLLINKSNIIYSSEGVQQGDPMGPLLFCLALRSLTSKLSTPLNLWYMDDGTLGGDASLIKQNLFTLRKEASTVGLVINEAKCEIYNPSNIDWPAEFKILDPTNFFLLGGAVTAESIKTMMTNKINDFSQLCQQLTKLPAHHAFTLLRHSLGCQKLISLFRSSPCFISTEINVLDNILRSTLKSVLNIQLPEQAWQQASLPIKLGGIGVRKPSDLVTSTYISSFKTVNELANLDDSYFKQALEIWSLQSSNRQPPQSNKQKEWDSIIAQSRLTQLIESATPSERCRLVSASDPYSGDWLQCLPNRQMGLHMQDDDFRCSLCFRLGLQVFEPHKCKCGEEVDALGRHGFVCRRNNGRILRHSMANECLSRSLATAGLPNVLEPPNVTESLRPDGLTTIPFNSGKSLAWDFTSPHPMVAAYLNIAYNRGAVSNLSEEKKDKKYQSLNDRYCFTPVAIDTIGAYGDKARVLIKEVGKRIARRTGDIKATSFFRQRLSVAIQRGNAKTLLWSVPLA